MQEIIVIHHETPIGEISFDVTFERTCNASPTNPEDTFEDIDVLEDDGALAYMSEKQLITTIKERT